MIATIGGAGPILSPWFVLPVAGVAMLVIAAHLLAIQLVPMPPSRRRIRTASGFLMLFVSSLIAYAFAIATPEEPTLFVLVWLAIIGLLGIIVMLACMDVLNTLRLRAAARREHRDRSAGRAELAGAGHGQRNGVDDAGGR